MQGHQIQENGRGRLKQHIPINLITEPPEDDFCPAAISAYKILYDLSKGHSNSHNIDITRHALAKCLNTTPQKSACALNCLERMGYIKILNLENEAKGCFTNKIELLYLGQFLKKTA